MPNTTEDVLRPDAGKNIDGLPVSQFRYFTTTDIVQTSSEEESEPLTEGQDFPSGDR